MAGPLCPIIRRHIPDCEVIPDFVDLEIFCGNEVPFALVMEHLDIDELTRDEIWNESK